MRKFIFRLLICVCLGVMGYSAYKILNQLHEYQVGDSTYKALEENIDTDTGNVADVLVHARRGQSTGQSIEAELLPGETGAEGTEETASAETDPSGSPAGDPGKELLRIVLPEVDFAALQEQNDDIVGWLYCEDTRINYPVVQGPDNDYYLHRMFTGGYNYAGCLFLESINAPDFTDYNSIIYGHHMRNGSMFHDLMKFKNKGFYEEHPYMIFMTPDKNYLMEIFAGFVSSVNTDAWQISFADEEEQMRWVDSLMNRSDFPSAITPLPEDHLLTLSTCTYEFSNARYVVYGVLTEVLPLEAAEEKTPASEETSADNR